MNLSNIPFDVFRDLILPLITISDLGALTMVDKSLKDLCDNNDIWKIIYMGTIRAKVMDTSIHYGPLYSRSRNTIKEQEILWFKMLLQIKEEDNYYKM